MTLPNRCCSGCWGRVRSSWPAAPPPSGGHANAVVSSDRLIDIVWGDEPPTTALSTLQKYVHRLRASVGDRLVTHPPGYVLRIDAGECDASRFESLLADATRLTTAGELSDAFAAFDAALALWRGPAWAEFADFDFARAEVARLDGLRATAIEDRTELALIAGRHAELIGELEATVAQYPLRERPRSQLMLALYRSGRHADAIRAYDVFRRYLGEEVGLEPSASLSQLADAILQQKGELDWVPPPGARGRPALPSGVVTFLFSDIEGSTRLFRQLGHGYVEVLERHRRLVRAAVAGAGGAEVNSEGDGLFFAFCDARAALGASVAAQRALVAEEWPPALRCKSEWGCTPVWQPPTTATTSRWRSPRRRGSKTPPMAARCCCPRPPWRRSVATCPATVRC